MTGALEAPPVHSHLNPLHSTTLGSSGAKLTTTDFSFLRILGLPHAAKVQQQCSQRHLRYVFWYWSGCLLYHQKHQGSQSSAGFSSISQYDPGLVAQLEHLHEDHVRLRRKYEVAVNEAQVWK